MLIFLGMIMVSIAYDRRMASFSGDAAEALGMSVGMNLTFKWLITYTHTEKPQQR
jgi:hypothetical protein